MSISGIGYHYNPNNTMANRNHKTKTGSYLPKNNTWEQADSGEAARSASAQDIYEAYKARNSYQERVVKEEDSASDEEASSDLDEQETDTEIIVKPDGSKVMMTTIRVGGMETVMSVEIAKATDYPMGNPAGNVDDPNIMVSDTSDAIESTPDK